MNIPLLLSDYFSYFIGAVVFSSITLYTLLKSPISMFFKDKPDARKVHKNPIPRMGGIVIIMTFLLLSVFAYCFHHFYLPSERIPQTLFLTMILSSLIIVVIGFFDDTNFVTVRVRHKLAAEISIAFITVYVLQINIGELSILGYFSLPLWLCKIISFLWIIALANAYNIIDGLDGLAGTLALIALFSIAIIANTGNQTSIIFISLLLSGAVIGFLIHNLPPAKTFMGDTGSIFLGTTIAILSLYAGREVVPTKAFIVMPLISGIPIIEVLVTMTRRYLKAKDKKRCRAECIHSMVIPDNSHIHHRLIYKGYSTSQSIALIAILSITLSCGAIICSVIAPVHFILIIIGYLSIPVYFTLYQLGFGGRFYKALHLSSTKYIGLTKSSLIGVIDTEGSFSEKLEQQTVDGVSYIKISENDIPSLHQHLRAAVVRELKTTDPETTIKKAEEISSLLRGPVYIIEDTKSTDVFVREVSKNGSLTINEKTASINELQKDFQRLSSTDRIRHYTNIIKSNDHLKQKQSSLC
jgi:UDP-GlcNAc:undecaprenyl-phosphate/decaprenyl-phosphate GlcNAc-1-phosphate transferase